MPHDPLPTSAAPTNPAGYVYGVAHVNAGELGHYDRFRTREDAEHNLRECLADKADCYLVRCPIGVWERVPDGE